MWKRCGICFRTSQPERTIASDPRAVASPAPLDHGVAQGIEALWISGEPAVWLGSGEKEWKHRVTTAFNAALPSEVPQWFDVEFRFLTDRLYRKDIDNLVTPILEAGRDGGWIERGFAWLGSVTSRKVTVVDSADVGVLITAHANPPALSQNRIGILIEADLPRMDETSVKWALYEKAFALFQRRPDLRFPPQTPVSVEIRVTINDDGKRKSIAALLKPCIDGLEPILGHPTNLLPERRESLQRRLAPQDEMILSLDFHVRGGPSTEVSALISPLSLTI
jgi:hypothetical protein